VAQKVQTIFTDDLDGTEAVGSVRFGLDGVDYEIDLSTAHVEELRQILAPYIAAGRKAGGAGGRPGRRSGRRGRGSGPSTSEVREWAKAQGIEVKDRGRVPADLVVKFQAATSD
jgi:Lsr2